MLLRLGKTHFWLGVTVILVFLYTGRIMDQEYGHLYEMEGMQRALFRAGHLYILLFGLANLALGAYMQAMEHKVAQVLQILGSIIMILSTYGIIYSFFTELPPEKIERPIARYSLYAILAGVSAHGIARLIENITKTIKQAKA